MRRVASVLATAITLAAACPVLLPTAEAQPFCEDRSWHRKCQPVPPPTPPDEPEPSPTPPPPDGSGVDLGVQFHGTWSDYDDTTRGLVLDKIKASGATWVRIDVGWGMIQPEPGSYDLDWGVPRVDRVIGQADARGLKVLVMFWMTPSWANDGEGTRTAPDDAQDYANAIGWAANRWGGKVDAWEVWNEPNSDSFLTGADPTTYVRLLCPAYRAVHANDTDSRVVFGGVMYNDDDWIRSAYAAGAKGCFDVMATHPYLGPSDAPPETPDDGHIWTLRHVRAVRNVMLANGDSSPIWATEFGWSSHANSGGEEPWERGVTEARQADYAVRALRLFESDYPYVTKAFWYNERAKDTGDAHQDGYGMLRHTGAAKPVFYAFRNHLLGY